MNRDLRLDVASRLASSLKAMQGGVRGHDSPALALRAALRQGAHGCFGRDPTADAALLGMVRLPTGESGELPALDASLGRILDDALLIGGLVAATRIAVHEPGSAERGTSRRSLGRDLRAIRARRPTASDDLLTALLRASREQLPRHLRRALTLMADDGAPVDVYALMGDLGAWDSDARWVQKRWAYHFWSQAEAREPNDEKGTA